MRAEPTADDDDDELNAATLRETYGEPQPLALRKELSEIDAHCRAFIEASPFVCVGSATLDGSVDVSPRGDPPGFVRVIDEHTLLLPDRPGNNRLDTLTNVAMTGSVGLLFLIPGRNDTLRVKGTARVVSRETLLAASAVNDKQPRSGLLVAVETVYLQCGRAPKRARLWEPEFRPGESLPSFAAMLSDQTMTEIDEAQSVRAERELY